MISNLNSNLKTYHLKTATKAKMLTALKRVLLTDPEGQLVLATHDYFISLIDELYTPSGVMLTDSEGQPYEEYSAIEGYHANLRSSDAAVIKELSKIAVQVRTPIIKIAGEK